MKDALAQLVMLAATAILFIGAAYMAVQALLVVIAGRGFEQLTNIFP